MHNREPTNQDAISISTLSSEILDQTSRDASVCAHSFVLRDPRPEEQGY